MILLLSLAQCDTAQMPPCSALIVVGTVTFDCPDRVATKP